MLYRAFDWLMTKTGRKYALVDILGNITGYRYYVFFVEKNAAVTWREKYLPNLIIHHFLGNEEQTRDNPGGEVAHKHPWATLSVILEGGYVEETNHEIVKEHKRFSFIYRPWDISHRIVSVTPNTWTLFFHGIRRGVWAWDLRVHTNICQYCTEMNGGVCVNVDKPLIVEFGPAREIQNTSKKSKGWKQPCWIKCDEGFDKLIADRKNAVARASITQDNIKWDAAVRSLSQTPQQK